FVAGRALSVNTGVYMGGWDTCITSTTGYIAGEEAAREMDEAPGAPLDDAFALEQLAKTLDLLGKPGVPPKDIVRRNQEIINPVDVSILKTGRGLSRALAELEELKENVLPEMTAQDPHYLLKLVEARSMTLLTEMYLKAALARQESRCGHFREDFPKRREMPEWMIVENADGQVHVSKRPVPLEKYPVQPRRYYMDDFAWPDAAGVRAPA
ncbi:MAG: FAD-binding protein, partial [Desulfovibrio sp.]|nr:FAD-binding protein [Desulfovibrio sp.]